MICITENAGGGQWVCLVCRCSDCPKTARIQRWGTRSWVCVGMNARRFIGLIPHDVVIPGCNLPGWVGGGVVDCVFPALLAVSHCPIGCINVDTE